MDRTFRNRNRSIQLLEALGYSCFKIPGSNDLFDIVGVSGLDTVFVAVTDGSGPSDAVIDVIKQLPAPGNCRKLVHVWLPSSRYPKTIELSRYQADDGAALSTPADKP